MKFSYNDTQLTLWIDEDEKAELKAMKDDDPQHFQSDDAMYDFFESLIANSELSWIDPSDTGDLTSAPILGILDYENHRPEKTGPFGAVDTGMNEYAPIIHRWGFMEYQVASPLEHLLATGKCHFVSSN